MSLSILTSHTLAEVGVVAESQEEQLSFGLGPHVEVEDLSKGGVGCLFWIQVWIGRSVP